MPGWQCTCAASRAPNLLHMTDTPCCSCGRRSEALSGGPTIRAFGAQGRFLCIAEAAVAAQQVGLPSRPAAILPTFDALLLARCACFLCPRSAPAFQTTHCSAPPHPHPCSG